MKRSALLVRVVPPVLVLGAVGIYLSPSLVGSDGAKRREMSVLAARADLSEGRETLVADLLAFADRRRDDEDAQWFAIEKLARVHSVRPAVERWAASSGRSSSQASARRLAALLAKELGHVAGDESKPTALFARCMQARIDGGDAAARATLDRAVDASTAQGVLALYGPIKGTPSPALDALATSFSRRADIPEMVAASAVLRARPGDVPTLATLEEHAARWRDGHPFFLRHVLRAIGTTGGAQARAFLAAEREKAQAGAAGEDQRLSIDVGLALAGDADAVRRMRAATQDGRYDWATVQWALGLGVLLAHGDESVVPDVAWIWVQAPREAVRLQVGRSILLAEREPPPSVPADMWSTTLAAAEGRVARAVGLAWALRRRLPGSLEALIAELLAVVRATDVVATARLEDEEPTACLEILRAFLRW